MRLAYVRGTVTINPRVDALNGRRLVVLEPVTMENLRARNGRVGGKALIAVDELGAHEGQLVAFTEGREAANPFWPQNAPVDAYCAMLIDQFDVETRV